MTAFAFQKLDVYLLAKDLALLVQRAAIRDLELRDQATRAAKSCFLNLAEGLPSFQAGVRGRHFAIARGSLGELAAAMDLSLALEVVDGARAREIGKAVERLASLLRALQRKA